MIKNFFKVVAFGALLTSAGAFAQDQEPQQISQRPKGQRDGQEMFAKLDADKDGKLSLAEVEKAPKGRLKENFAAIDANKDNFIDKEELVAYRKARQEKRKSEKK